MALYIEQKLCLHENEVPGFNVIDGLPVFGAVDVCLRRGLLSRVDNVRAQDIVRRIRVARRWALHLARTGAMGLSSDNLPSLLTPFTIICSMRIKDTTNYVRFL